MKANKDIVESIKSDLPDIRAEILIADLIEKGIDLNKIFVRPAGVFERNYSKDIQEVTVDMFNDVINIKINRDGLYDLLPEGLFHPLTRLADKDNKDRKKEFEKQKLEESNARKFFAPLDDAFYHQRVNLEIEMARFIKNPWAVLMGYFFSDQEIPVIYCQRFIKYIPFINEIKGDIELTGECLSEIIGEKVSVSAKYLNKMISENNLNDSNITETIILGCNFILGNRFHESIRVWEFSIILEDDSNISGYADYHKDFGRKLINKFYQYFIPSEVEIETKFICTKTSPLTLYYTVDKESTSNKVKASELFLGFNTSI